MSIALSNVLGAKRTLSYLRSFVVDMHNLNNKVNRFILRHSASN